jgi:fatty acid desaturase
VTTLDNPSIAQFLVFKLGKAITQKQDKAKEASHARTWVQATIRLMLHLAGLGCLTLAGFSWNMTAGLVIGGLSFFVLSWLTTTNTSQPSGPPVDPMATRR